MADPSYPQGAGPQLLEVIKHLVGLHDDAAPDAQDARQTKLIKDEAAQSKQRVQEDLPVVGRVKAKPYKGPTKPKQQMGPPSPGQSRTSSGPKDTTPGAAKKQAADYNNPYRSPHKGETDKERLLRETAYYHWQRVNAEQTGDQQTTDKIYTNMGQQSPDVAGNQDPTQNMFNRMRNAIRPYTNPQLPGMPTSAYNDPGGRDMNMAANLGIGAAGGKIAETLIMPILQRGGMALVQKMLGPEAVKMAQQLMSKGTKPGEAVATGARAAGYASKAPKGAAPAAAAGPKPVTPKGAAQAVNQVAGKGTTTATAPSGSATVRAAETTRAPKPVRAPAKPAEAPAPAKPAQSASTPERNAEWEAAKKRFPQREGETTKEYNRRVAEEMRKAAPPKTPKAPKPAKEPAKVAEAAPAKPAKEETAAARGRDLSPGKQADRDAFHARFKELQKSEPHREGESQSDFNKRMTRKVNAEKAARTRAAQVQAAPKKENVGGRGKTSPSKAEVATPVKTASKDKVATPDERDAAIKGKRQAAARKAADAGEEVAPVASPQELQASMTKFTNFKVKFMKDHPNATEQEMHKAWRKEQKID